MNFAAPAAWLLLALLPMMGWRLLASDNQRAVSFSGARLARDLAPSWRQQSAWIPPALRLLALGLLVAALAQPRRGLTSRATEAEGIAIELALDRSGSMERDDFRLQGQRVTRLEAVKDVAGRFIAGDRDLPGRPDDMIGLVTFAGASDNACPLTLDHDFLLAKLQSTGVIEQFQDDGTAIGDALGLAVERLHALDEHRAKAHRSPVASKVVILLSDGENNAGLIEPRDAARLAAAMRVRVHAIRVRPRDQASSSVSEGEQTLREIAIATGGKLFAASDTESLTAIYREIDRLERSRFHDRPYLDHREWAIEKVHFGPFAFPPLALAALVLVAAQVALDATIYRKAP